MPAEQAAAMPRRPAPEQSFLLRTFRDRHGLRYELVDLRSGELRRFKNLALLCRALSQIQGGLR